MSDGSDDRRNAVPPVQNITGLTPSNSQIGNVTQVVGSPGAVVAQVNVEPNSALTGILAGILGVLLLLLVCVLPLVGRVVPSGIAVIVVGLSSALIVAGFFSFVDSLLRSTTKSEIAGWLVNVEVGKKVVPWPESFTKVFDRVFGGGRISWVFVLRASLISAGIMLPVGLLLVRFGASLIWPTVPILCGYIAYSDLSLLKSRYVLRLIAQTKSFVTVVLLLFADMCLTVMMFSFVYLLASRPSVAKGMTMFQAFVVSLLLSLIPALFADLWIWLYATAGFLLKAARHFDIGFQWFNRKFDIEKKPLQSIGFVAGGIVALVYWCGLVILPILRIL